ncbi:MAG: acetate kinase [Candidatus Carbobacillus altaicus]|nr:acetate kinase [Candidatus Carbobacillus altaicus]
MKKPLILVLNSGSSSIKFQLFDMSAETVLARGLIERIGLDIATIHFQVGDETYKQAEEIWSHEGAIDVILRLLTDGKKPPLSRKEALAGIGHRVVHGGEAFQAPVLIDDEVIRVIYEHIDLAPLHNPANLKGIEATRAQFGNWVPMVAVFDTAFHQTMGEEAYLYAIPYTLYRRHKVRRYGFHGTSHHYVWEELIRLAGDAWRSRKVVSLHLGNGASACAIQAGKVVETSMGMTPLEGLVMGTRSGDIDPAVLPYVMAKEDLSIAEVQAMLNKHSGLLGLSEKTSDMREILAFMFEGDVGADRAFRVFMHRLKKYVGAYAATMGGIDALILTGGIGEHAAPVREALLAGLSFLGFDLDRRANVEKKDGFRRITSDTSRAHAFVIPTDEERFIARETYRLLKAEGLL